ncbi:MAG: hypothetical protein M9887_00010 [Chitinophagales bacterium]|nr:hypothetical protein [Chitinophagales bacterium]
MNIYPGKDRKTKVFYSTYWMRSTSDNGNQFYLSVKSPLKQNDQYDFTLAFFKNASRQEITDTREALEESIKNYIQSITTQTSDRLSLNQSSETTIKELDKIVNQGLKNYRIVNQQTFQGFSDIISKQLGSFNEKAEKLRKEDENQTANLLSEKYENKINAILSQANLEVQQFLNNEMLILVEVKDVQDHPTVKQKNTIAINGGYGGVWFKGNLNNFDYDHSPYIGLSFPLGKRAFSSKFWSNSSISTGIFILDFKDGDGNKVKGPIIQKPLYVAFGYKLFRFLRLNAGAVLLERKTDNSNFVNADKIFARPFVGLSLELNFWADFAK